MKYPDLKKVADDWAEKIYHHICVACTDPTVALSDEETQLYKELKEWGWFELCPLDNDGVEAITRMHLALGKYAKLKWQKEHPVKSKPSKWEVVMGKARQKR